MGALKRYEVEVPYKGGVHKTTLLLSDEDARRDGLLKEPVKAKVAPTNEAKKPANKATKPQSTK